jgi:galactokinase
MKNIYITLILMLSFLGCKNESNMSSSGSNNETDTQEKTISQSDGLTLLKGEFIYYADASVLQTQQQMYGVVIDEKMHELNLMAKKFKNEDTDFVEVEIRGKITPKPKDEEGWDYRVEIKEIVNVKAVSKSSDVVKLGTE